MFSVPYTYCPADMHQIWASPHAHARHEGRAHGLQHHHPRGAIQAGGSLSHRSYMRETCHRQASSFAHPCLTPCASAINPRPKAVLSRCALAVARRGDRTTPITSRKIPLPLTLRSHGRSVRRKVQRRKAPIWEQALGRPPPDDTARTRKSSLGPPGHARFRAFPPTHPGPASP